jgi:hypothetical protein
MRGVEDLLDAVHVAGETGDDHASWSCPEHGLDGRGELAVGGGETGDVGVGGVGQEQIDAFLAEPGEPAQVGDPPVQRELIHLEIAGVQHQTGVRADGDRESVRDRVVDREELQAERTCSQGLARLHLVQNGLNAVLGELRRNEAQGEARADQRNVRALAEQVRHATDAVLVSVCEHDRDHIGQPVPDGTPIRQDDIHTGLVFLGEEHSTIDHEQLALVFEHGHVPADLTESAERDDAKAGRG